MATQKMAEILLFQRGMTAQRRAELKHILKLSESIHHQAQKRSWQMAAQLQKTRRQAIDVFFEQAPQAYEAETIHDVLKQVLALDAIAPHVCLPDRPAYNNQGVRLGLAGRVFPLQSHKTIQSSIVQ